MAEGKATDTAKPGVGTRRGERPLSPHLLIYRFPVTAVASILTRITGNGLIVAVILVVWWLMAAATSPDAFALANGLATSWFGDLVFTLATLGIWYHYLAGLRHLYMDAGHGLEIGMAERLSWGCIAGAVLLTLITVLIV
jgi:succinate dehydrogenase / fumarate reductase cytochrome b subunit